MVDFNAGKTQLDFFNWSECTSAFDMKIDGSVLVENHLLRSWVCLSLLSPLLLRLGSCIISIAKTASKKTLIHSMKFISP